MNSKRVLLIQPPLPNTLKAGVQEGMRKHFVPLGLGYLASSLEQNAFEAVILDMQAENVTIEALKIDPNDFLAVGITSVTNTYPNALRIAKLIKMQSPETKVVLGGPHVTFCTQEVFQNSSDVDVVVRGEGEKSLVETVMAFANHKELFGIPGITFRNKDEIINTPPRPVEERLDLFPPPARHLFSDHLYSFNAVVGSRGCPGRCIFCAAGAMNEYTFRSRNPEKIIEELRDLSPSKKVIFYDNTFLGGSAQANSFLQHLIKADVNLEWNAELRVDRVDGKVLDLLKASGCTGVQFGVESGSDLVLHKIGKGIITSQVLFAVKRAKSAGLEVVCSFCIGHPFDTTDSIQQTISFMQELRSEGAHCVASIVTPFPGTPIFNYPERFGIKILHYNWEEYTLYQPVISTRYLSAKEIGTLFMSAMLETLPSLRTMPKD